MHPNNEQPAGVTCDNWFLGIYCDCLDCKALMDDALHLNGAVFAETQHQEQASLFSSIGQHAPIDPLLFTNEAPVSSLTLPSDKTNNNIAKPTAAYPAQQQQYVFCNPMLVEPTKEDLSKALGLGSPFQEARPLPAQNQQATKNQYPDPSTFSMLPMPHLFTPGPDFTNHNENAAAIQESNARPRASSFGTNASSPPELYSPNLYGTPGPTPQSDLLNTPSLHPGSPESVNNTMASNNRTHQQQQSSTRRLRSHNSQTNYTNKKNNVAYSPQLSLPPPALASHSPQSSISALPPSQDQETATIMAQQKPKPISITPDMSDAEKARLCEANDAIFAERLRIQRAKNNCAAKKSRQRRLDLIKDLQNEVAQHRMLIEELTAERDEFKGNMDGLNRSIAELQRDNAELLREKVEAQREVLGAASLKAERDGLREDLSHQQGLVKSLMMRLTTGGGGGQTADSSSSNGS